MTVAALKAIQLSDLNQLAKQMHFDPSKAQILYWAPLNTKDSLPNLSQFSDAFQTKGKEALPDYKPRERLKSAIKTPPAKPGTIVSESYNSKIGAYEWLLSNGVVVVLKKTSLAADRVVMSHEQSGVASSVADEDVVAADYAATLTDAMGFDQISPRALQQFQVAKGLTYSFNISFLGRQIYGESTSGNLIDLLQINYQRITNSSRDLGFFKIAQAYLKQSLMAANQSSDQVFNDQLRRLMFRDHPRTIYIRPIRAIETLNADQVISTFERINDNFNGSYFVLVGNLDFDDLRIQLSKYLANLPSKERDLSPKRAFPAFSQGVVEREIFLGDEGKAGLAIAFLNEMQTRQDSDRLHVELLNQILYQRVWKRLRERESLIYGLDVSSVYFNSGRALATIVYLPGAPEKIERIEKEFLSEIEQLQSKLVTTEELAEAKKKILSTHHESMQNNQYVASKLLEIELRRSSGEMYLEPEKILSKLTETSLRQAAQRFYDLQHMAKLKRFPASMATGPQAELERYTKQVPRDRGYENIKTIHTEVFELGRSIISPLLKENGFRFSDFSKQAPILERLKENLSEVVVSACMDRSKAIVLERIVQLKRIMQLVGVEADVKIRAGDEVPEKRLDQFLKDLKRYHELSKEFDAAEKCKDGAPELP